MIFIMTHWYNYIDWYSWLFWGYTPAAFGALIVICYGLFSRIPWGRVTCRKCGTVLTDVDPKENENCLHCKVELNSINDIKISRGLVPKHFLAAIIVLTLPWLGIYVYGYSKYYSDRDARLPETLQSLNHETFMLQFSAQYSEKLLWLELIDRLNNQKITRKDIALIMKEIIRQTKLQTRKDSPAHCAEAITIAHQQNLVNDKDLVALAEQLIPDPEPVQIIEQYHYDKKSLELRTQTFTNIANYRDWSNLFEIYYYVTKATADGFDAEIIDGYDDMGLGKISFFYPLRLTNGKMKLDIEVTYHVLPLDMTYGLKDFNLEDLVGSLGKWKKTMKTTWYVDLQAQEKEQFILSKN
ncbi:hypothetical protein JD969_12895 [Planctomycetota bacterium]|nr:hypothetical protein JD969_12895 [Planctomycetota bacterium]